MKIAYILDVFPQLTQTFVANEIQQLCALGLDIYVYSINKSTIAGNYGNFKVHYLSDETGFARHLVISQLIKRFLKNPLAIIKVLRIIKKHDTGMKFDLRNTFILAQLIKSAGINHIHAHFASRATLYAMCASFLTGIAYSFTTHAYDIFLNPNMIEEKHRFAKFAVTISEYNRHYMESRFGIEGGKIHVLRCAIKTDLLKRKKYKYIENKKFSVLSVGRLVEKKGFEYLIKACRIYMDTVNENIECRIVGEGPLRKLLEKLIEDLDLGKNVFILGEKSHNEILELLECADVFVLACVQSKEGDMDGIPVSLMEAMARGVIAVSTEISAIPELIDDTRFLAKPANESQLANILELISKLDKEEKNKIALQQIKKIEKCFNLNKETKKLAELFQQDSLL